MLLLQVRYTSNIWQPTLVSIDNWIFETSEMWLQNFLFSISNGRAPFQLVVASIFDLSQCNSSWLAYSFVFVDHDLTTITIFPRSNLWWCWTQLKKFMNLLNYISSHIASQPFKCFYLLTMCSTIWSSAIIGPKSLESFANELYKFKGKR